MKKVLSEGKAYVGFWFHCTSNPMMQIVGSFTEFECEMLHERTRNGLAAVRLEGRTGGRRPKLTSQLQKEIVLLVTSGQKTGADAARLFRARPSTIVRLIARNRLSGI